MSVIPDGYKQVTFRGGPLDGEFMLLRDDRETYVYRVHHFPASRWFGKRGVTRHHYREVLKKSVKSSDFEHFDPSNPPENY